MAGSNPLADLVMAAANLKAASPQFYAQFVDAIRAYEVQAIGELIAGDQPHDLFRAQGKVKTVQQLRKHLVECREMRETYTRRDQNARQPSA